MRLHIVSDFSYTLESLIQAGHKNIATTAVPVRTNAKLRDSRLFKSMGQYIRRSAGTILRIYALYRPMRAFLVLGTLLATAGVVLGGRFLYYYAIGMGSGKVQSLLLAVVLLVVGAQTVLTGVLADVMSHNRSLVEDVLYRIRRMELKDSAEPAATPVAKKR